MIWDPRSRTGAQPVLRQRVGQHVGQETVSGKKIVRPSQGRAPGGVATPPDGAPVRVPSPSGQPSGGAPFVPPVEPWTGLVTAPAADKVSIGIRLDRDILAWFKAQGPGYQTRINAVLRRYVEAQATKP